VRAIIRRCTSLAVIRIGRISEATCWLGRAAILPAVASLLFVLPSHEGTRQTSRRTALGQDLGSVGLMRHRPALNRRRPPGSSARLNSPEPHFWRHGQAKAGASPGACVPSAIAGGAAQSGDAIFPEDPAAVLRMAEAVGSTSLGRAESPRSRPLTLAVFRLARQAVTFGSRHLSPVRRPPQGIRRSVPFSPAFQSSCGRSAPLGRFMYPAALMGFNPSQLYSGRTVPQRLPSRRPTCRLPVASTSMILVEASAARTGET